MKFNYLLIATLAGFLLFSGCQKELDPGGVSTGALKDTTTGDCLPFIVNGVFVVDSTLSNTHYVDVEADITQAGTFEIKSDTINGYSFYKKGTVGEGRNRIRLYATGKPTAAGVNTFTITYGTSTCSFDITVFTGGSAGTAQFTLGGSPGNCSVSSTSGTYQAGQVMTAANKVEMTVNVTTVGTYVVTGASVNGITFSASGTFTNPGIQNIFLSATGTPVVAGTFVFPISNSSTTCSFPITFTAAGPPATYTLGGNPGNCTGVILAGTYMAGVSTSSANTVKVDVVVATTGSYSLSTQTLNGIKFSANGTFTGTGTQTVTLTANTAVPATQGPFNYIITGASSTCGFTVTYLPAPPPASFTLSGGPGNCTPATVNGTYTAGTALNASNNLEIEVNVSVVGAYTISTNTVNGMQFTKSGVFTTTGLQNVTLAATAGSNPTAAGTTTLTPLAGSSSCTIDVVVGAPSDRLYSFKIGATTYSGPCSAFLYDAGGSWTLNIYDTGAGGLDMDLINPSGTITTGLYTGTSTSVKHAIFGYNLQLASFPGSGLTNLSATITSIDATNRIVIGTFSGTVSDLGLNILTVTNGTFKADY